MQSPQFKGKATAIFNKKIDLSEFRAVNPRSIVGLYFSQVLLFLGILLIIFNGMDIVSPGSYFGAVNWLTITIFSIGLCINFISIPFLYFSSFSNFKKESDFWDKETFWILPLFFFGTFFLYNSRVSLATSLLMISVIVILVIHAKFFMDAYRIFVKNQSCSLAGCGQYFMTMKYLSAYYLLLLALLVFINPLQYLFNWIRLH